MIYLFSIRNLELIIRSIKLVSIIVKTRVLKSITLLGWKTVIFEVSFEKVSSSLSFLIRSLDYYLHNFMYKSIFMRILEIIKVKFAINIVQV